MPAPPVTTATSPVKIFYSLLSVFLQIKSDCSPYHRNAVSPSRASHPDILILGSWFLELVSGS
jgi:hypothetical protein